MIGEVLHERRIVRVVAALHRLLKVLLRVVVDAERLLVARARRIEGAAADVGGTAEVAELFDDRHARARFESGDRRGKTRSAAAHHHDVARHGVGQDGRFMDALEEGLVGSGLLECLARALEHRKARDACARNAVDPRGLLSDDPISQGFDRFGADARAFEGVVRGDLDDASAFERHFDREGRDESHHLFPVYAVFGRGPDLCGERKAEGERKKLLDLQHGFLLLRVRRGETPGRFGHVVPKACLGNRDQVKKSEDPQSSFRTKRTVSGARSATLWTLSLR